MCSNHVRRVVLCSTILISSTGFLFAQDGFKQAFKASSVYAGIEVGSKGVKMSLLELGKDAKSTGSFTILKDTTVNTDFISFTPPTFSATLIGLSNLFNV